MAHYGHSVLLCPHCNLSGLGLGLAVKVSVTVTDTMEHATIACLLESVTLCTLQILIFSDDHHN